MYHDDDKARKVFAGVQIVSGCSVLLGMKRRGFGQGLWQHTFAGKVEKNESTIEAAKRELEEESGLLAELSDLQKVAFIEYEFTDAKIVPVIMQMHIYKAVKWTGQPTISEEISPQWFKTSEIPYAKMWLDNRSVINIIVNIEKLFCYFSALSNY